MCALESRARDKGILVSSPADAEESGGFYSIEASLAGGAVVTVYVPNNVALVVGSQINVATGRHGHYFRSLAAAARSSERGGERRGGRIEREGRGDTVLETIADFDLTHPAIQAQVKERFGDDVPLNQVVVSPAAMFEAPILETIFEN